MVCCWFEDTDYTASTGSSITGLSALSASDVVTVVSFETFAIPDAVSEQDGGTFQGDVHIPNATINDGGTIGSATTPSAVTIASNGDVDFAAALQVGSSDVAEYGTNSNGSYVRFYNGVQACWGVDSETLAGGVAVEVLSPMVFPATFSAAPVIQGTTKQIVLNTIGREHMPYQYQGFPSTTGYRFGIVPVAGDSTTTAADIDIHWVAIGVWS